jgi:hypothetical protein
MHCGGGILLARYPHVEALIGENFKKGSSEQAGSFRNSAI